jgi:AcrR family transcriptional regulator
MPVAGKTRKDVVTEFREAEILTAARQVFARRGFADASMEEISQVAGLAKGTLYLYYPSKRELYRAALRAGLVALCEVLERVVAAAPSLSARLQAYVVTKVAYFEEHADFFRIYHAEFGNATSGATDRDFRELCLRQIRMLERAIREGAKGGGAPSFAPEEVAHAVFDMTRGVIVRRLLGWTDARKAEREVTFVVDFAKKALGCK